MIPLDKVIESDKKWSVNLNDERLNILYIRSPHIAVKAVTKLLNSPKKVLGFDIETGKKEAYRNDSQAGLCPYRSFPSLLQFYDGVDTCYLFDALFISPEIFKPIFETKILTAHNAIFDLQHIKHSYGAAPKIDCTMILYNMVRCAEFASLEEEENAIEEEWEGGEGEGAALDWLAKYERHGASLRAVTAKLLGIKVDKELQVSNWTDRPLSARQLVYAAYDAKFTYQIRQILIKKVKEFGMEQIYALNRQALHPVVSMILNGCKINEKQHAIDIKKWAKEKDVVHVKILKIFGREANIRSTVQISSWLEKNIPVAVQHTWPRSDKTGRLKSDAKTLDKFSHLSFVQPLLEYKKLDKLLNTYGQPLLDKICPVTKRLHGSFTLGYTATGRLSSRSPNLQNLPRSTDIRGIFTAPKDKILLGADYSQIEIRVAALLSGDKTMLKAYDKGLDLHEYTATQLTGKKQVSKGERQLAKAINFGLLFGLGAKGLVEYAQWNYGATLTQDEAYKHVYTFFDTYSGYAGWQKKMRDLAQSTEQTKTQMGKVRRLTEKGWYTRSVNHPVQGSAAEIVITALCLLQKELRGTRIKMINCVHDEILLECPETEKVSAAAKLKSCMEQAMHKLFPTATLNKLVDIHYGKTWAETKG